MSCRSYLLNICSRVSWVYPLWVFLRAQAEFCNGSERSWWVVYNSSNIQSDESCHQSCCRDFLGWRIWVACRQVWGLLEWSRNYICSFWSCSLSCERKSSVPWLVWAKPGTIMNRSSMLFVPRWAGGEEFIVENVLAVSRELMPSPRVRV